MQKRWFILAVLIPVSLSLIACGGGSLNTPAAVRANTTVTTPNVAGVTPSAVNSTSGASTMTSAATASSSIPSSATVFDGLQNSGDWSDCSDCAGGATTSSYWTAPFQSSPSMSGSSRQFTIFGGPWSDVLWIRKLGAHNDAKHFLWDFYVYFDTDSAANAHAAEYDLWQTINGQEFMVGSQCVFDENHWDLWDSSISQWINSGLPCPRFTPNTWHHIAWDVERINDNQYRYNTLWVDDQTIPIQKVFYAQPSDWEDNLGVQWQLDQDGQGHPIKEWVDNSRLTIW